MFLRPLSIISLIFIFSTSLVFAQKEEYSILTISDSLKENANAVVRLNQIDIVVGSQRSMNIKTKRIVTILNENGLQAIEAYEFYDKSSPVKNISATILGAFGNEIKKIKKADFRDFSAVSGSTLFSDSRYLYFSYIPIQYPITVVFESETQTSNTAFIPQWMPLSNYSVSVEKSILNVTYPSNLGFKYKEFNFSDFNVKKAAETATGISFMATQISARKAESKSPSTIYLFPRVMMGLEMFHIEGVDGYAKNWLEFGKWYSEKILTGTAELPEATKAKMKILVGAETDPIKKAQIIYKYVQDKSRYVSIQVGIGGWKPMLATDVDRLGYGDCKALSNYTKALLSAVDVPSYNTLLYGDTTKRDIESDFVSMQGNHMILAVPNKDSYVFLECTSQVNPFGYQGIFTDDRNVLVIKPEGGEIVRTKIYEDESNSQTSKGFYSIAENGDFSGAIEIISEGAKYNEKFNNEKFSSTEIEVFYKDYWSTINNLTIKKITFNNDVDKISFTENATITALNYGNLRANKMMFAINAFHPLVQNVKRIRNRKNPMQIERGSIDRDEIEITLPDNFSVEFLPSNFEINEKFGEYKTEFIKKSTNTIILKRKLFLKKGLYTNKEYDDFRLFMEQISRNDNTKIILTKN